MAGKSLVVVSESFSKQRLARVEAGLEPRIDMLDLARELNADLLTLDSLRNDAKPVAGEIRAQYCPFSANHDLKSNMKNAALLAWNAHKVGDQYQAIFVTGEDIAIPYAALQTMVKRSARVIALAHYLSPRKKTMFLKRRFINKHIDKWLFYSPIQMQFAQRELGFSRYQTKLIHFHADTGFYCPDLAQTKRDSNMIVSAGMEHRDYRTLFQATAPLNVRLELGVGSPWSRYNHDLPDLPENAEAYFRSREEMRQLYRKAAIVVVPLVENDFQAGISVILEAQAAGAAVIASGTRGLAPVLKDSSIKLVEPENPVALRAAISELLNNKSKLADQRNRAVESASKTSTQAFVQQLAAIVENRTLNLQHVL